MILRAGVHVKTAPPAAVAPWLCVWRNKDGLRCHVGRVYDPALFDLGTAEYAQGNFPRKRPSTMTLIGGTVVTRAPEANMSKDTSGGFKTSSVQVYYNTQFGKADLGTPTLVAVPQAGYAFWPEGKYKNAGAGVYVILSRLEGEGQQTKWALSICLEEEVVPKDIKIACLAGSSCIQIWQSDITYAVGGGQAECYFPFKIEVDQANGNYKVGMGSINGYIVGPQTGSVSGGQVFFTAVAQESNGSVSGGSISAGPSFDTGSLKIPIGMITGNVQDGFQIYQTLTNSLYWEVFKCGTGPTEYYCNGV